MHRADIIIVSPGNSISGGVGVKDTNTTFWLLISVVNKVLLIVTELIVVTLTTLYSNSPLTETFPLGDIAEQTRKRGVDVVTCPDRTIAPLEMSLDIVPKV